MNCYLHKSVLLIDAGFIVFVDVRNNKDQNLFEVFHSKFIQRFATVQKVSYSGRELQIYIAKLLIWFECNVELHLKEF